MGSLTEQIEADLDIFYDTQSGFAEDAVFLNTIEPYTIPVILFDEESEATRSPYGEEPEATRPRIMVRTKDVDRFRHRDTFEIKGRKYMVEIKLSEFYGETEFQVVRIHE